MASSAGDLGPLVSGNAEPADTSEQICEQVARVFAEAQRIPYNRWKAPDLDYYDCYSHPDRDSTFDAFEALNMALFRLLDTAMSKRGSYITFDRRFNELSRALESLEEALSGHSNKIAWLELCDLVVCTTAIASNAGGKRLESQSRMMPIFARAVRCIDALDGEFSKRDLQESERIASWTLYFLPDSDYETALDGVSSWLTRLAQEFTPSRR